MFKKYPKLIGLVTPLLLSIICCVIARYIGLILFFIPRESSFHFNLIMVSSLLGGFLYTNYSLLIGLSDKELIKKIQNTSIIKRRNDHILVGILCSVISMLAGIILCLSTISTVTGGFFGFIFCLLINAELCYMLFAIMFFILSLSKMHTLVKAVNSTPPKYSESEIEQLKSQIKRNKENRMVDD